MPLRTHDSRVLAEETMAAPTLPKESSLVATPIDRFFDIFEEGPLGGFNRMRRMMDAMLGSTWPSTTVTATGDGVAVNIYEKDDAYVVEAAVPGYKREDLTVEVIGDMLTLAGKFEAKTEEEQKNYHRREIRQGGFTRSFSFPSTLDPKSVTAHFENGLLSISVKPEHVVQSTKVPIN
ncbi:Hsp20/alpha crystallin family protein [bacterium]|nr:MAG: Hsp20/alpha crystallin family protein [bacterium]